MTTEHTDTERLDWLQSQSTGYGSGWVLRMSENGRGLRLHETSRADAERSIRAAIDKAMEEGIPES